MKPGTLHATPRWAERLLVRLLPASRRDDITGDLAEEFQARQIEGTAARWWYLRQAFGLIGRQIYAGGKMRAILLFFCAFTLLACCWLTSMEGVLHHAGFSARMILDSFLGAVSLVTGLAVLVRAQAAWRRLALAAALLTGGVGVWAVAHGARAAHFEGFAFVIGIALLAQAVLALWVLGLHSPGERV